MLKEILKKYPPGFWAFVTAIMIITVVIMLINSYSTVSVKELTEGAELHIAVIEEELYGIQDEMNEYGSMIDKFTEINSSRKLLEEEIAVMLSKFMENNKLVNDVFYDLDENGMYADSLGKWKRIQNIENGEAEYIYIRSIWNEDSYMGCIGAVISSRSIEEQMDSLWEAQTWNYLILLEEEAQDYLRHFSKDQKEIYASIKLNTGLYYVEIHESLKRTQNSNEMILLISMFAIAAMWMIQRSRRTGKTIFDIAADYVMKDYSNDMSSLKIQGNKATFAMNIGMTIAIFADVLYSIALGRDIIILVEYILFFMVSFSVLFLYKHSKWGITERMATGIIVLGFIFSLAEHLYSGGFIAGRAGDSFLWFLICLYFGLFILGSPKSGHVFLIFTVVLFFDVILETVLFRESNYVGNYLFTVSFLLLGFALYVTMELYVSGAVGHYNRKRELIEELRTNQALLLRKEKLSSLGQLISGVSYEINTPIGAIKASAETMDSMLKTVIEEVLDAAEIFDQIEYDAFQEIVAMALDAMGKMKSTWEVRKAKKIVREYLKEKGVANWEIIADLLGQLEIVDETVLAERLDLFQMEHIAEILEKVTRLTAFTSGIPTTIHASDSVSKIVLALKSYIHTSENGERFEFDLIESIENVLVLYHNQIKGKIVINRIYDEKKCLMIGSQDEIAQIWTNLIQNAIEAMPDGGELTIQVQETAKKVIVSIGDTGKGIPPELLDNIYDPFFTTKKDEEGGGLGLNITKRLIEKHGGALIVESQVGKGCIFYVGFKRMEA